LRTDIERPPEEHLARFNRSGRSWFNGKGHGSHVEPDVIKKLDQLRQQNKIDSMEDLEKAVTAQGATGKISKNNIRNSAALVE